MYALSTHDFYYSTLEDSETEMEQKPVKAGSDREGGSVYYEVETSTGNKGIVVHEVGEVYIYIPAELSAAGFELKIAGSVRVIDKVSELDMCCSVVTCCVASGCPVLC